MVNMVPTITYPSTLVYSLERRYYLEVTVAVLQCLQNLQSRADLVVTADLWHPDIMTLWHVVVNRLDMSLTRLCWQIIVYQFEIFFPTTQDIRYMLVCQLLMCWWGRRCRWKVLSNCKQSSSPSHHTNKQLQTQTTTPHHTTPPQVYSAHHSPYWGQDHRTGTCLFYFSLADITHWTSTSVVQTAKRKCFVRSYVKITVLGPASI